VAFQSLLVERRKLLHERIGNVIEELFASRLDDHLVEIAHHHVRGGNANKATHFLMLAAQQLIWISIDEAIVYVNQGLSLLEHIADETVRARREAALRVALGFALSRRDPASREVEAAYLRARELCAKLDDDNLLCTALAGLRLCYNFRAELDRALELGTEMLKVAERAGDSSMICGAHSHLSQTLYFRGEFHLALEHIESAAPLMNQFIAEPNLTFLGDVEGRGLLIRCLLGYPEQAEPSALPALFLNQSQSALFRELFTSQIYYFLRDSVRVALHAERGIQAARDFGWHQAVGFITAMSGWSLAASGKTAEGVAEIRRALEIIHASGARVKTLPIIALAECYLLANEPDEAFEVLADALEHARRTGERFCEAELHRLTGEVLTRRGSTHYPEAEAAFRAGIEVARRQDARWFELRATTSLARLLAKQGQRAEARAMLADIYSWFTEGFDTADLKDAKALLDQLSG
jgi:predicted ATPase